MLRRRTAKSGQTLIRTRQKKTPVPTGNQYNELTGKIEENRSRKKALLDAAELPLPELSVREGELVYKGKWDNMSGSERLIVSTAIVRRLNPECGFVLLDKLEQMDMQTLAEFDSGWKQRDYRPLRPG